MGTELGFRPSVRGRASRGRGGVGLAAAEGPNWVRKGGGRRTLVGCVPGRCGP